jgi:hypothetical protein
MTEDVALLAKAVVEIVVKLLLRDVTGGKGCVGLSDREETVLERGFVVRVPVGAETDVEAEVELIREAWVKAAGPVWKW